MGVPPSIPGPAVVVVDSSVAVKWVLTEVDSDRAEALLRWISGASIRVIVPAHFFVECAAVLQKRARRGDLTRQDALDLYTTLQDAPLVIHGDPMLGYHALDAAGRYELGSAYDAHYVALAELFRADRAEFWTADVRLFNALGGRAPFVHLLHEYPLP